MKNFSNLESFNIKLFNNRNEIKINFQEKTYSIFFNEKDTIKSIIEKIKTMNEKINFVDFKLNTDLKLKEKENIENLNFSEVGKNSFYITLNKKYQEHFIPSLYSQLINSEVKKFIKNPEDYNNMEFTNDVEEIKNEILYQIYRLKTNENKENFNKIYKEMLKCIKDNLTIRKLNLLNLQGDQKLSEIFYNKTLKSRINLFNKLGISFALSNFIVFYALIYKFYAWDVIEPITYIVGNVYWIITLGFLVFNNRKLGFELIESQSVMEIYSDKIAKKTRFNKDEKLMIENELQKIEDLMKILEDLNNNNPIKV
jgi:hypothetical protein